MLALLKNSSNVVITPVNTSAIEAVFKQSVRFKKPRWLPRAPSKIFLVRQPDPGDPEENKILIPNRRRYKTALRSVCAFIKERSEREESIRDSQAVKHADEDVTEIFQVNEQWNQETRLIREARQRQEEVEKEEEKLRRLIARESEKEENARKARAVFQQNQKRLEKFITLENLDEEIEKALSRKYLYNFAIDTDGNHYVEQADGKVKIVERSEAQQRNPIIEISMNQS